MLNLGILAHVDAGKTSLTERLLHAAGVIDEVGSVDEGNTQTDSLALERQRGITIKSAVVSFVIDDITVNLIDTPGHPDFIAEVERVLGVLDGAVLVISAVEGVDELIAGIKELLPAAEGETHGPVSGTVFKVERGPAGEKIAYVRMFSGTVTVRDRLQLGGDEEEKVTAISVFDRGSAVQRASVAAGRIGRLWGVGEVRIGDVIGEPRTTPQRHYFAPPTLETVVVPRSVADKGALHVALTQLAEQDPLINVRQDDSRQEIFVSLYGEVQKDVVGATLANDYDIDVEFRETTMICIERPIGVGAAVELLPKTRSPTTPFLATIGLRIEPAALDSGGHFGLDLKVGSIPIHVYKTIEAFHEAMERTVLETR